LWDIREKLGRELTPEEAQLLAALPALFDELDGAQAPREAAPGRA
jgi:hypothetical protein